MQFRSLVFSFWLAGVAVAASQANARDTSVQERDASNGGEGGTVGIAPKVFIIDLYVDEGESWYSTSLDLLAHNLTIPGLSPLFPSVHCNPDFSICQLITGEAEINAASSVSALALSPVFDLRQTYFLVAGVAGVNPLVATTASVTFVRYAIQCALQYEFDIRDLPSNFSTGYIPQGSLYPNEYPQEIYGTEVFELNSLLRDRAMELVQAANVTLVDSPAAQAYRALFNNAPLDVNGTNDFAVAAASPHLVACDTLTSDVYFSGTLLSEAFGNYTTLVTNGSGVYCTSQQEDNAVLEALLRADLANRTDFSRVMVMRTASDFVTPPPGVSQYDNLMYGQDGYEPALANIPVAGVPIVTGIVAGWEQQFELGIKPQNYVGDIFGSLGGTPDYGPGPTMEPVELELPSDKRSLNEQPALKSVRRANRRSLTKKANLMPRLRVRG